MTDRRIQMMKAGIEKSDLKGYKWTAKTDGLHWEYCDVVFKLRISDDVGEQPHKVVGFTDFQSGVGEKVIVINDESEAWLCDGYKDFAHDIDEAIMFATEKIIRTANYLY